MDQPTTPTGIRITSCDECGTNHAETRGHCLKCGTATAFIDPDGICIHCHMKEGDDL